MLPPTVPQLDDPCEVGRGGILFADHVSRVLGPESETVIEHRSLQTDDPVVGERRLAPFRRVGRIGGHLRGLVDDHQAHDALRAVGADVAQGVEHAERPAQQHESVELERVDQCREIVPALREGVAGERPARSSLPAGIDGDHLEAVGETRQLMHEEVGRAGPPGQHHDRGAGTGAEHAQIHVVGDGDLGDRDGCRKGREHGRCRHGFIMADPAAAGGSQIRQALV